METILELRNIRKIFGGNIVLDNMNLAFQRRLSAGRRTDRAGRAAGKISGPQGCTEGGNQHYVSGSAGDS